MKRKRSQGDNLPERNNQRRDATNEMGVGCISPLSFYDTRDYILPVFKAHLTDFAYNCA